MNLGLVIDTSLQGVALALADLEHSSPHELLWITQFMDNAGSAQAISSLLREGLRSLGKTPADLAGATVSVGPGSFTGIKIGLSFCYGLAAGLNHGLKFRSASALATAAAALRSTIGDSVCPLFLPSTRTHGFLAVATVDDVSTLLVNVSDSETMNRLRERLTGSRSWYVTGSWPLLEERVAAYSEVTVARADVSEVSERAIRGMAEDARRHWPDGFTTEPPVPDYHRLATAEERLRQQHGG